jgi:uncharacterized protein YjbJ (UPF0337 family)
VGQLFALAACFPGRLAELDCGVLAWTGTALRFMRFPGHLRAGETKDGYRQGPSERFRGAGQGQVKEWTGKVTGDSKTESEGKADQAKGKIRNTVGGIKDTLRGK